MTAKLPHSYRRAMILLAMAVPLLSGLLCGCDDPGDEGLAGMSGRSFILDDQYVIVNNGYRGYRGDSHDSWNEVTYVVVRNWPASSSSEERLDDGRFLLRGGEDPQIRLPDGRYQSVENTSRLYFYDGERLAQFPISMREDDFMDFHPETMIDYGDVLDYFKGYENRPSNQALHIGATDRARARTQSLGGASHGEAPWPQGAEPSWTQIG